MRREFQRRGAEDAEERGEGWERRVFATEQEDGRGEGNFNAEARRAQRNADEDGEKNFYHRGAEEEEKRRRRGGEEEEKRRRRR